MVADIDASAAARARVRFDFARASADWRELVADPRVGLVSITSPNILHKEMALADHRRRQVRLLRETARRLTTEDARELTSAAEAKGRAHHGGLQLSLLARYLAHQEAPGLWRALGTLTYLRACFDEDYMADPAVPFSWRCERAKAGSGSLGDLGSHAVSLARFLGGPIVEVLGDTATVVPKRAVAPPGADLQFGRVEQPSERRRVENEDIAHCLIRFANGAMGSLTD